MRIEFESLSRSFPGVKAVRDVSLVFEPGRLYAIVGENGAGKTTLMRLLYGMLRPDSGSIRKDGVDLKLSGSHDAIAAGIGMVHQHFMLVDTLSVAENLVLGAEPLRRGLLDHRASRAAVSDFAARYGFELNPDSLIGDLSVGQAQRVEILKVLYRGAQFLIFDEPTGVLSPQESRQLFDILRRLVLEGKTVVLITHKLDEVLELADEIVVMRRGSWVGSLLRGEADAASLARMMVGREVLFRVEKTQASPGDVRLVAEELRLDRRGGGAALHGVSFAIRAGEILGIAGVEGNGQRELAALLTGLQRPDGGCIRLDGEELIGLDPRRARELGIRHVPEDRQRTGLILDMSIAENLILGEEGSGWASRMGFLRGAAVARFAGGRAGAYDIRGAESASSVAELSGGNQQKLVLARELAGELRLLVASQPTRGVDVGAIEFIHRSLLELRDAGLAILLISSELPELLALGDRVGVMYKGRLDRIFASGECTEEELGLYMTGAAREGERA